MPTGKSRLRFHNKNTGTILQLDQSRETARGGLTDEEKLGEISDHSSAVCHRPLETPPVCIQHQKLPTRPEKQKFHRVQETSLGEKF